MAWFVLCEIIYSLQPEHLSSYIVEVIWSMPIEKQAAYS